jgi:hypothetical protein
MSGLNWQNVCWVFGNRVLRKVCGLKRDSVTGDSRKFHFEDLHDLYSSPDIIHMIKSRRMRWAGHVARVGETNDVCWIWWEFRRERGPLEDPGLGGRILLKWMFNRFGGRGQV